MDKACIIAAQPGYSVGERVKDAVIAWRISEGAGGLVVQPITVQGLVADRKAEVNYFEEGMEAVSVSLERKTVERS